MDAVEGTNGRWERERAEQARAQRAKARRQPLIFITVCNVVILGVASISVADLRRLQTPHGTGLRWLQAALYGDCQDYLTYSVPHASRPDSRTRDQLCQDLRSASRVAQAESVRVGSDPQVVDGERVSVKLTRNGVTRTVVMHVVKVDGRWRVLRDQLTCSSVGCA